MTNDETPVKWSRTSGEGGAMSIEIGKQYVFDYPKEFVTLPEYSKRRGKVVVAEALMQEGNEDEEAMYQVRVVEDGWIGEAFESELIAQVERGE